jgi:hypothetical protein
MIYRDIGIVTKGAVAIGKIDVLRMHAAEVYVAPAIGDLFGCRYWHNQAGSYFFGQWLDVQRAHTMLALVRSTMERDFLSFFAAAADAENPKTLAASFSEGMGHRLSQRLHRLKAGRTANMLARGRDAVAEFVSQLQITLLKTIRRRPQPSSAIAYAAGLEAGDRVALNPPA